MTAVGLAPARARRRPSVVLIAGLVIVGASLVLAIVPGLVAPYDPAAFDYRALMQPPGWAHLFGTDNFGRDILSRVIWAYRLDMQIALFTTLFPVAFGTAIGALVGYYGGIWEPIFGRIVDVVITFPFLVLVIAIVAVLGPGLFNMWRCRSCWAPAWAISASAPSRRPPNGAC
ncbi:MAG: ABC transporter permease [Inquilinus limosus]|uniref:ABC transporter permease n=1 Tax=Inquilinus limosus TaxID=171674 RepID=A0A952FJM2_9PROT|nr:ABC transporter permease [Inquilinus limosus]